MFKLVNKLLVLAFLTASGCTAYNSTAPSESIAPPTSSSPATPASSRAAPATSFTTATSATPTPSPLIDTVVIPGERFGPITRDTTRQDLTHLFDEAALTDRDIAGAEGETIPGTVVNLGTERSFTVIWTDDARTQLAAIRNPGTAWKTPQGIGVETPFTVLQEKLGQFELYGFAWDYGGTLLLKDSQLDDYDGLLILRVQPAAEGAETSADYRAVMGEALFPSTNPHFQSLDLKVREMIVYLAPQNQE